jgi:hypothetical protein
VTAQRHPAGSAAALAAIGTSTPLPGPCLCLSRRAKRGADAGAAGEKPVPDAVFAQYLRQFAYDKTPLDAKIEEAKETPTGRFFERIGSRVRPPEPGASPDLDSRLAALSWGGGALFRLMAGLRNMPQVRHDERGQIKLNH